MAQRDFLEKDYYKVLGVEQTATKDEIKRAYRKLAQKYHPDANAGDKDAEARFKEISAAHSILTNDEKRAEYDQVRSFAQSGGQRFYGFQPGGQGSVRINIGDLFGDNGDVGDIGSIFEDAFGFRTRPARGTDVEMEVTISFDAAIAGTTITLPRGGKARIPVGVTDGARIKVSGKGQASPNGGPAGDLYVRVHVAPHPIFKLLGSGNLEVIVPVTIAEAALGAKVEVPTLDGSVTVKVPAGTQNGKVLRVKGRGVSKSNGGAGDLLVKIAVQVPEKLARKEKEALERFAELHTESPRKHFENYIRKPAETRD
jgi:molecular chaperone DnaJ